MVWTGCIRCHTDAAARMEHGPLAGVAGDMELTEWKLKSGGGGDADRDLADAVCIETAD